GMGQLGAVKMGPGVMGRVSAVAVAIVITGGAATWALQGVPLLAGGIFLATLATAWHLVNQGISYARKHPNHAVMEGAELVRHTEITQAAKNSKIIEGKAKVVGNTAPPKAISSQGDKGE